MNPSTAQASVLVDELVRNDVRHVVVCPGSRNAPLSMALDAAARAGRLTLHVRIDERSAGFLALGLARALAYRGRGLAAVLCTSGTAVANLHPAVLEAHHSNVGLLLLTADRPAELHGTGANQTIEQRGLFGPAAASMEFPVAYRDGGQNRIWRGLVCRAVALARAGGPVQVNLPFREPLVPDADPSWPEPLDGRADGGPWTRSAPAAPPAVLTTPAVPTAANSLLTTPAVPAAANSLLTTPAVPAAANSLLTTPAVPAAANSLLTTPAVPAAANSLLTTPAVPAAANSLPAVPMPSAPVLAGVSSPDGVSSPEHPRTLMIVGDDHGERVLAAVEIAARVGWPVIAEPTVAPVALAAGAHLLGSGSLLLGVRGLPAELTPDSVVVVGRPTLSRAVATLLRRVPVVHLVGPQPRWSDPQHLATDVSGQLSPDQPAADPSWLAGWQRADEAAGTAVDKLLAEEPGRTGLHVARELVDALPAGAGLFLGSSNPIRGVDLVARPRADLLVLANRGVAGIDGSVSTAAGLALGLGRPGYALLGDLTFLHDINGLLIGPSESRPDLAIVVCNDNGGGIFALLEQGAPEHAASFERVFGTPHHADLAALCAGYRVPHTLVEDTAQLRAALAPTSGLRVIEARVSRDDLRDLHARLRTAVNTAVTGTAIS